jgi:glycosyltransferase involved in cell wall biosynthesis
LQPVNSLSNSPGYPKTVSFVVLALNEEKHIEKTIQTVLDAAKASTIEAFELVLVDDGSTDDTGRLMDQIASQRPLANVVHNEHNLGFGAAYLRGVAAATQEYVMIIAGDNIMPGHSITAILDLIGPTDILLPFMTDARFREPVRRIGSWVFARFINVLFGHRIRYYNSMVVRRALFEGVQITASGYSLQAECIMKFLAKGATYQEIGVAYGYEHVKKTSSYALHPKNLMNLARSLTDLVAEHHRSSK